MPGKRLNPVAREMVGKLLNYFNLEKHNGGPILPVQAVQERVSVALGVSARTVSRIANQTPEERTAPNASASKYGPRRKNKTENLSEPMKMEVRNAIYDMYIERKPITLKTIKEELTSKEIMDISEPSLCRLLPHIGFKYKKEDYRRTLMERSNIVAQRTEFLRKYRQNQDSAEKRQVVFLGETWIFAKGSKKRTWNDTSKKNSQKPCGFEGKRFVVINAGHSEGFVDNTSFINPSTSKLADYHADMNGEIFIKWVKEQLVPNLKKPSLIVMDNAPYHSVLLERQPKSSWPKTQIAKWLQDNNIPVEGSKFKAELLALAKAHAKPGRYVVDEYLKDHGHETLRLPPYHCQFNAIELIWEQVKEFFDDHIGKEGYGDNKVLAMWQKSLETCNPERWASVVEQTESLINTWFDRELLLENVPEFIFNIGIDGNSDDEFTNSDSECEQTFPYYYPEVTIKEERSESNRYVDTTLNLDESIKCNEREGPPAFHQVTIKTERY